MDTYNENLSDNNSYPTTPNIVLEEDIYNKLMQIKNMAKEANKDMDFLIAGEEKNNDIWLNTIIANYKSGSISSNFNKIKPILSEFVNAVERGDFPDETNQVICRGCTDVFGKGFSEEKHNNYLKMTESYPLLKSNQIKSIAMLMPNQNEITFMDYNNKNIATFTNVYVNRENGLDQISKKEIYSRKVA